MISPRARARAPTVLLRGRSQTRFAEPGGNGGRALLRKGPPQEGSPRPRPGGIPGKETRQENRSPRASTPGFPSRSREGPSPALAVPADFPLAPLRHGFPSRSREGPNCAPSRPLTNAFRRTRRKWWESIAQKRTAPRGEPPAEGRGETRERKRAKRIAPLALQPRVSPRARARAPIVLLIALARALPWPAKIVHTRLILVKQRNQPCGTASYFRPTGIKYSGSSSLPMRRMRCTPRSSNAPTGTPPRPSATACSSTFCAACPASIHAYRMPRC